MGGSGLGFAGDERRRSYSRFGNAAWRIPRCQGARQGGCWRGGFWLRWFEWTRIPQKPVGDGRLLENLDFNSLAMDSKAVFKYLRSTDIKLIQKSQNMCHSFLCLDMQIDITLDRSDRYANWSAWSCFYFFNRQHPTVLISQGGICAARKVPWNEWSKSCVFSEVKFPWKDTTH